MIIRCVLEIGFFMGLILHSIKTYNLEITELGTSIPLDSDNVKKYWSFYHIPSYLLTWTLPSMIYPFPAMHSLLVTINLWNPTLKDKE